MHNIRSTVSQNPSPRIVALAIGTILAIVLLLIAPSAVSAAKKYTTDFRIEDCTWSNNSDQNPHFILKPKYRLFLEGVEDGETIKQRITVLSRTKTISFTSAKGVDLTVKTRVVEEKEWEDGEVVEISRNWFALCKETGDVYYFGEEVDDFEDGELVGHEGAWIAGEDDALPGIIMPGSFLIGARYMQETAPGVAMDRGENKATGLDVTVPAGSFTDCVAVKDTSALDPGGGGDMKIYCPGIGIVMDAVLELTKIRVAK